MSDTIGAGTLAKVPDLAQLPIPPGPGPAVPQVDDLLKHPGPLPKRPKGDPPPGLPPLDIMGFMSMLPPGVPLPEGLLPEMPEEEPEPEQINKKKRNRQIGSWIEFMDESGRPYYQHIDTKEVQWETPKDFGGTDWVEYETDDKRKYYYNISTGSTVWDKPAEMTPSEKPQFIKELEAAEQKRAIEEKQRQRKANARTGISASCEVELPLTADQIKQNNIKEAKLREKFRMERERRSKAASNNNGDTLQYLPEELREREQKREARRLAREAKEKEALTMLKEQSKRRKVEELQPIDVDEFDGESVECIDLSD
eukprot:TRINITY_DN11270_c0_g1_i1.p1 TRINITY_DN11270_c0_g1~~TRINITY_DN11270_c0_g1_i1.p1  ORF type:complete len:312 (+),score=71.80 TRINITY_DN11270_c0_g1_i1:92-1027(+)